MNATFFPNTLPANTAQLVEKIHAILPEFLKSFYLSGGTGLSLQIGHRESEDLDFFCSGAFNTLQLEKDVTILEVTVLRATVQSLARLCLWSL
jgi:hypothetical protein